MLYHYGRAFLKVLALLPRINVIIVLILLNGGNRIKIKAGYSVLS